jgi:sugar O-acyltransferase (sialic acid O-acetyltransferase NeuD family)
MNYLYGAGGHGKVVYDAMLESQIICDGFIDDNVIERYADLPVYKKLILNQEENINLHLAIGHCKTREILAGQIINANFFSVVHPRATIAKTSVVGKGSFLASNSVIAPNANVGIHCVINHGAIIDHDCCVGDFSHVAPGVILGGGVKVGRGVLVGAGAVILPRLSIGKNAIIGAGAVVTEDIPAGTTVVGNPAKAIINK